jgi:hypothetical protein
LAQVPNFLLAAPTLLLSVAAIAVLCMQRRDPGVASRFAGRRALPLTAVRVLCESEWTPHCCLLALQCVTAVCASHVQTVTRFVASSPVLYAGAALLCAQARARRVTVIAFFLLYSIVGTILFNAFYPWT